MGLEALGIHVVLPDRQYMHADLPILSPRVAGAIIQPGDLTILDAGGDDVGVTVLSALKDSLSIRKVQMLQVINPHRPFTGTVEGCIRIKNEIELSSKLNVTGLVSNANLMDETTLQTIQEGYRMIMDLSGTTGIPAAFITVPAALMHELDLSAFDCPVLPIYRKLIPPWKIT
jgi:hypothetical protein